MAPLLILLAKPFLWPWDVSAIYWMDCSEISSARFLIERLRDNDVTWMASSQSGLSIEMANLNLSTCFSCKGTAVWVKDRIAYPETKSTIAATEEMPAPVRKDFEEAASIVDKSPRGAAALLRLCVQKLMPLLGEKGKKIDDDIASLVRKRLEPDIQQALDVVRVTGNNAVHPGQIILEDDKATAVALFELVNLIVERRIATPKRIAAMYGKL